MLPAGWPRQLPLQQLLNWMFAAVAGETARQQVWRGDTLLNML
jgi:hypothetical protein